ncbi:SGNH/GDSL hydrolase family protein [Paenarthrobacter nitroguajacolicus]|uniref:SGNH/GDSL hydrolase family protein n=1 Tax=Paenarthrobacter nitroguajacolicus TaxID=211146 RepID=UPI0015BCE258|nr:SGNH/GDSL hydrolase family protein [Paenarthrobacter nitroguajacolicus]NWL34417.1 hypothetical protein [Paenarthrobacter nitroguajacolicus]
MDAVTLSQALVDAKKKYVGKPGTRRSMIPLSAPNQTTAATSSDFTFRSMVKFPRPVKRWRLGIMNRNLRSTTIPTSPITVTGVYIGEPVYGASVASGGRWVGACTGALTQVDDGFTVPVNGNRGWSDWVTEETFEAGVERVISWGSTTAATGTGVAFGNSLQVIRAAGSANAGNATLSGATTGVSLAFGDIVIEYEFAEPIQTGLFVGDSNTLHYNPSTPPLLPSAGAGTLPYETWPCVAGDMGGFAAINLGVGSTTMAEWGSTVPILWDRVDLASYVADFAVVSLGTNSLAAGQSQAFLDNFRLINAKLRALGITRIFWTDITPREYANLHGTLTAAASAGATSISSTYNAPNGTILIGSGTNAEQVTVSGTSGAGPYTLTVGALANAHAVGESVTSGNEMERRLYNNLLRQLPDGITGVVPFEKALEASPNSPSCDPRYVSHDALHFLRSANAVKAQVTISAGVAPKIN